MSVLNIGHVLVSSEAHTIVSVANRANLFEQVTSRLWCCRHIIDKAEAEFPLLPLLSVQLSQVTLQTGVRY
jgi:hypothetical protein